MESNTTCAANTEDKPNAHTITLLCSICLNHTYRIVTNFTPIGDMDIFTLRRLILQRCTMSSDTCKKEHSKGKPSTIILARLQPIPEMQNSLSCQKKWDWRTSLIRWLNTTRTASHPTSPNKEDKKPHFLDTFETKSLQKKSENF